MPKKVTEVTRKELRIMYPHISFPRDLDKAKDFLKKEGLKIKVPTPNVYEPTPEEIEATRREMLIQKSLRLMAEKYIENLTEEERTELLDEQKETIKK